MRFLVILLSLLLTLQAAFSQGALDGKWDGEIRVGGIQLEIHVTFHDTSGQMSATIDIPPQHAYGLPLQNIRYAKPVVHFELPAGPGVAIFEGTHAADSITGIFVQGGALGTFALTSASIAQSHRPADTPPPYKVEEVTFRDGTLNLAGTLTTPETTGPHPALVLLTGSGPQDRDEDVLGFKIFKDLADVLTRSGIAVLRFDDRGVGGSGGNQADCTDDDYAADAMAAVELLRMRPEIDSSRIGLLGHSEGASAASIAASMHPHTIAFLVLMAGGALRGDSVINSQIVRLGLAAGKTGADLEESLQLQKEIYTAVREGGDMTRARGILHDKAARAYRTLTPAQRAAVKDSVAFVTQAVEIPLAATKSRWFRRFIDLDPAAYLKKVRCPVLALFGERDHQVFLELNKPPMEEALRGNKDGTVRVVPKANHLFQLAGTGLPSEYASLPKSFAPGFTDTLTAWLEARLHIGK